MIRKTFTESFLWVTRKFRQDVPRFKIIDTTPSRQMKYNFIVSRMKLIRHDGLHMSLLSYKFDESIRHESMIIVNGINSCPVDHESFNDMLNYAIEIGNSSGIPNEDYQ